MYPHTYPHHQVEVIFVWKLMMILVRWLRVRALKGEEIGRGGEGKRISFQGDQLIVREDTFQEQIGE